MIPDQKLPARVDHNLPLMFSIPPALPGPLAERIASRVKVALDEYFATGKTSVAINVLQEIQTALGEPLPEPEKVKPRSKGTLQEIIGFCVSQGLPPTDGEWFYYRCEGNGWYNGKAKIKDWPATIRAWKLQGYMPSQKPQRAVMGFPATGPNQGNLAENQLNKMARKLGGTSK